MSSIHDSFAHPELHHLANEKLDKLADLIEATAHSKHVQSPSSLDRMINRYLFLLAKIEKTPIHGTVNSELSRQEFMKKAAENKAKLLGRLTKISEISATDQGKTKLPSERQAGKVEVAAEPLIQRMTPAKKRANPFQTVVENTRAMKLLASKIEEISLEDLNEELFGEKVNGCVFAFVERNSTQVVLDSIQNQQRDHEKKLGYKKYIGRLHKTEKDVLEKLLVRVNFAKDQGHRELLEKLLKLQHKSVMIKKMNEYISLVLEDAKNATP